MAFAIKAPRISDIDVEYKVNSNGWSKLQFGRDFGVIGTDSVQFSPVLGTPILDSNYSLLGANLKVQGKNALFEGANKVSLRILQGGAIKATKTIDLNYLILGLGVQESDSMGAPAKSENMIFYRSGSWGDAIQKRTFVFLGTRQKLDSIDIRIQSGYGETAKAFGVDSNLLKLPMLGAEADVEEDGWRMRKIDLGTILEVRISKSLFTESILPNQNQRQVIIYGKIILTPGFPPDNTPFKIKLPISL